MSEKSKTPITDKAATDGWVGDALAVPVEVCESLELQNAELLEALKAMVNYGRATGRVSDPLITQAQAAISKAEGSHAPELLQNKQGEQSPPSKD